MGTRFLRGVLCLFLLVLTLSCGPAREPHLVILHTNDTHSHLEPIRAGERAGWLGVVERAAYVDSVRAAEGEENVLYLDAGDWNQGTSYYNVLGGRLEADLLNAMRLDAVCLGNHEFDDGLDHLASRLERIKCPVLCANYDFSFHRLGDLVCPSAVFWRGGIKVGVIGLLTDVRSVVDSAIARQMVYLDPLETMERYGRQLREQQGCQMVIALTHIGYEAKGKDGQTDLSLAARSRQVDLIIGGHSHTNLKEATVVSNAEGHPVTVVTDYKWGYYVGRVDVTR